MTVDIKNPLTLEGVFDILGLFVPNSATPLLLFEKE